jgi:pimeloyl-ACP methyl ester carboxylesterase
MELIGVDKGLGPALLLIHGWCGDSAHFAHQVEAFAVRHRVLVPDLPWHGTGSSEGEISIGSFAAALADSLDRKRVDRVVVVGHSMGGMVAVKLASIRPDLVAGVIVLDSAFAMRPEGLSGLQGLVPLLSGPDRITAMKGLAAGLFEPSDDPALRSRVVDQMVNSLQRLQAEGLQTMVDFIVGEGDELFARLKQPTATILAANPPSDPERLRTLNRRAYVAQVLAAGHYVQLFAAAQVNAMIADFIELARDDV